MSTLKGRRTVAIVLAVGVALALAAAGAQAATHKAEVRIKGKASTSGAITFKFVPVGGEEKEIQVNVLQKMKEDEIARDVMKELAIALGPDYKVKVSGANVKVSKSDKKKADFDLTLAGLSVGDLSVVIKPK